MFAKGGCNVMSDNLSIIIEYVNNNVLFGSKLKNEKVEELFGKYPISNSEKEIVFSELKSLNIEIIYSKISFKEKIKKLLKNIGLNNELNESDLIQWFETEKISLDMQEQTRSILNKLGYSVINNVHKDLNIEDFSFLDDLDFEDLDSVLDDESFNNKVTKAKNVIDKSHNLDYLIEFHSKNNDFESKHESLNNLVKANEKLVWKIVLRYKQLSTVAVDVNDMYQMGMQGLMKAVKKFDISLGNQFSTYAIWWIRQSITRGIADYSTTIRIPVHMREKLIKYIKIENEFWIQYGRVPTNTELAQILDLTLTDAQNLELYKEFSNLTSLETAIGPGEGSYLGDFIWDNQQQSPEDSAMENELKRELEIILDNKLKPKEARIIKFRFGLIDGTTHTLEEIGKVEKVTRERIRQIEAKAISKLQNPNILERLRDFYYDRK